MDDIPLWLLFLGTTILIVGTIELGYILGRAIHRRSVDEKESPVSAIAGTILALLAFMLAFTFGIVADRYDDRLDLVRDQANAIRTVYERSDFLPESGRNETKNLLRSYLVILLEVPQSSDQEEIVTTIRELKTIEARLWEIAVANVRSGDTTDISALYVESLNDLNDVLANRIDVAVEIRMPDELWIALYLLVALAMVAVGYQTAIAESQRTGMLIVLAVSFAIVITLIAALDDPERGYIKVPQQPLHDLQAELA
jgi:CDP-diglyceride synthetase